MTLRLARTSGLLLALSLVAAACGGGGGGTISIQGQKANNHGTKSVSGKEELEMEMDNYYFNPTILKGSPGEKLTIEFENEGNTTHNFTFGTQDLKNVSAGQKATVSITLPQSGTVVFFCKFHKSLGMLGEAEVSS